jgi:hypothetical protein
LDASLIVGRWPGLLHISYIRAPTSRPKYLPPWYCPRVAQLFAEICEPKRGCTRVAELFYIPCDKVVFQLILVFNLSPGCIVVARHLNVHQLTSLERVRFDVSPDLATHLSPRSVYRFPIIANLDLLFHQDFLFHWVKDNPLFVSWIPLLYYCLGHLHLVLASVFLCIR